MEEFSNREFEFMNILAIDTSTNNLSISLKCGEKIFQENRNLGLIHSEQLMPIVSKMIKSAGINKLDLILCSKGPGSFTGLRIGMATAKGLSLGYGCPIKSINYLDVLAYGYENYNGIVLPCIDAKRSCIFTAIYRKGERITEYLDVNFEKLKNIITDKYDILLTGPDAELSYINLKDMNKNIKIELDNNRFNYKSEVILEFGYKKFIDEGPDSENEGPTYLRKSDAETG